MGNIHDGNHGRRIVTLDGIRTKRLAADFPGWGADNAGDYLTAIPGGLGGRIDQVNSHGSAPYTRYTIAFDDGTRGVDLAYGTDFLFVAGDCHTEGLGCRRPGLSAYHDGDHL